MIMRTVAFVMLSAVISANLAACQRVSDTLDFARSWVEAQDSLLKPGHGDSGSKLVARPDDAAPIRVNLPPSPTTTRNKACDAQTKTQASDPNPTDETTCDTGASESQLAGADPIASARLPSVVIYTR